MGEEWRKTPLSDAYEVSSLGNVRSVDRVVKRGSGVFKIVGKSLRLQIDHHGYNYVNLIVDGKHKQVKVHRLVAMTFIDNPQSKPEVNHLDNNPRNNTVSNLEWCTHRENMEWMHRNGRAERTEEWLNNLHKSQEKIYKAVIGTNLQTGEEVRFNNLNSVATAGFQPSCVCCCCNRKRKQHKGYSWRYAQWKA